MDPVKEFEKVCENAVQAQEELLLEILSKNSTCEYLQRYGQPLSLEAFKAQVPIVSYEEIVGDIQRIADGDTSPILCCDPIKECMISSGTTSGKHKIIPRCGTSEAKSNKIYMTAAAYRNRAFPFNETTNPVALAFTYCMKQFKSKSGLPLGATTTSVFKSQRYKDQKSTSPYEVILSASDWRETTYCHLLCGLLQRHSADYIIAVFAYTLSEAMRMFRQEWKQLCEDISTGRLSIEKVTDEKLRFAVSPVLKPSKELAEEIRNICSSESWDGIIPLLWPRVKYVLTIVTGAMQPYVPTLKRYAGEVPIAGFDYASSEGYIAINVEPGCPPEEVVFTVAPFLHYYEFIPVDASAEDEKGSIVGVGEVEPGRLYELVLTTSEGLYRYKVGDVVEVTGFYYNAPQMAFKYRKNVALSITTDKVDEQELQNVILNAAAAHGVEVANFSSYADFTSEQPPHYVIFWELASEDSSKRHNALRECCETMDVDFNVKYISGRVNKAIGALELAVVAQGTFEKLMQHAVSTGASPVQYKTPRCVANPAALELLRNGVVCSFRSSTEVCASLLDEWKPSFPLV